MEKKWLVIFLVLIGINLTVVDGLVIWGWQKNKGNTELVAIDEVKEESGVEDRVSDLENKIKEIIEEKEVKEEISVTSMPIRTVTQAVTKTRHVSYMNISGGFGQVAYEWTDVPASEFYFDKSEYPGLKEIKFESNMKLFNGNGMGYVRLFDVTHGVALSGSQVETKNQNDTVIISEAVNFMSGKNLIRVQVKSLTADTTVFNSGRLMIVSEY